MRLGPYLVHRRWTSVRLLFGQRRTHRVVFLPEKRKVGGSTPPLTTTQLTTDGPVTRPNVLCCWICSALLMTVDARSRPSFAVHWGTRGARHVMLDHGCGLFVPKPSAAVCAASTAVCVTWERSSIDVRWRLPLTVAIVTHLVTRSPTPRRPGWPAPAGPFSTPTGNLLLSPGEERCGGVETNRRICCR